MDKVLCYSCNKSKHKLNIKKSILLPINLLMCEGCISSKFEPRWLMYRDWETDRKSVV